MRKASGLVVGLAIALAMALMAGTAGAVELGNAVRLAGDNRYDTARRISDTFFLGTVPVTYIATGTNFPDALAGGAAAAKGEGNILLVQRDSIPGHTDAALKAHVPGKIVILGGEDAISEATADLLANYTGGDTVRIAGATRYDTAVELSESAFPAGVPVVYVATGANFPDALAASAAAGTQGGPVLLVPPTGLTQALEDELTRLAPQRIIVLGGQTIVSNTILTALGQFSNDVDRIAGLDRYGTSAEVSEDAFPNTTTHAYLATGANFPDALAIGPAAASVQRPVLLVRKDCIPVIVANELDRLSLSGATIVGGPVAVEQPVLDGDECLGLGI